MCIRNRAALLAFTDFFCTTPPLGIWGNSQLFYKIGHLSILVMLLVDSAEIATAQKAVLPGDAFLRQHMPPCSGTLAPGAQPGTRALRISLSFPLPGW